MCESVFDLVLNTQILKLELTILCISIYIIGTKINSRLSYVISLKQLVDLTN